MAACGAAAEVILICATSRPLSTSQLSLPNLHPIGKLLNTAIGRHSTSLCQHFVQRSSLSTRHVGCPSVRKCFVQGCLKSRIHEGPSSQSSVSRSAARISAVATPTIEVEQIPVPSDSELGVVLPTPHTLSSEPGVSSLDDPPLRLFTFAEVAQHNTEEDCWLIIQGKVYDVTPWVQQHPGGSIIAVNAGKECTQLFETYHPTRVRSMLNRYCIGRIESVSAINPRVGTPVLHYCEEESTKGFYPTLKKRVEEYFRENKVNPRVHPHMFLKSGVILGGFWLCYYLTFFATDLRALSLLPAVGMGVLTAQVGASIMHDANHGSYGEGKRVAYAMGATLDMVGSSSFLWRHQHVVGHHQTTNVDHFDPDIRVEDPDVRRLTYDQPVRWYHSYQHIYMAVLYSLLTMKSIFFDDFHSIATGRIGVIELPKMNPVERAVFWGGKVGYAIYMIALPLTFGSHSGGTSAALYIVSQLVAGWTLSLLFQVAHVVEKAEFPSPTTGEKGGEAKVDKGWAAAQVATTADFSVDSWFWTHFSGGLNHQVEHHLFPGICHVYYPYLQPIVKATCEEFGIQYHCYPDVLTAIKAHFEYIKKVGVNGAEFRLGG